MDELEKLLLEGIRLSAGGSPQRDLSLVRRVGTLFPHKDRYSIVDRLTQKMRKSGKIAFRKGKWIILY